MNRVEDRRADVRYLTLRYAHGRKLVEDLDIGSLRIATHLNEDYSSAISA
jgi:hypothetical protein